MSHNHLVATTDLLGVFDDISGEDAEVWQDARTFGSECLPLINDYWERGEYPLALVRRLGELDLLSDGVAVPGHRHMSTLAAGLTLMEVSRADASMGTVIAVQAGLAMRSIDLLGSQEQRERWLPGMAESCSEHSASPSPTTARIPLPSRLPPCAQMVAGSSTATSGG